MTGSLVVGEFQLAEGNLLSHPVRPRVRRLWVNVDFVSFRENYGNELKYILSHEASVRKHREYTVYVHWLFLAT